MRTVASGMTWEKAREMEASKGEAQMGRFRQGHAQALGRLRMPIERHQILAILHHDIRQQPRPRTPPEYPGSPGRNQ